MSGRSFAALFFGTCVSTAALGGCTQPQRILDAGVPTDDAPSSMLDAPTDAGVPATDVTATDVSAPDDGSATDAGVTDAGPPDAGPSGACTNAADRAALPMSYSGMTVEEHARACFGSCFGEPVGAMRQACLNDCIQGPTRVDGAITSACTACVALRMDCAVSNCLSSCGASPTGATCISCQCTNGCFAMADACSGIPSGLCP